MRVSLIPVPVPMTYMGKDPRTAIDLVDGGQSILTAERRTAEIKVGLAHEAGIEGVLVIDT